VLKRTKTNKTTTTKTKKYMLINYIYTTNRVCMCTGMAHLSTEACMWLFMLIW